MSRVTDRKMTEMPQPMYVMYVRISACSPDGPVLEMSCQAKHNYNNIPKNLNITLNKDVSGAVYALCCNSRAEYRSW